MRWNFLRVDLLTKRLEFTEVDEFWGQSLSTRASTADFLLCCPRSHLNLTCTPVRSPHFFPSLYTTFLFLQFPFPFHQLTSCLPINYAASTLKCSSKSGGCHLVGLPQIRANHCLLCSYPSLANKLNLQLGVKSNSTRLTRDSLQLQHQLQWI